MDLCPECNGILDYDSSWQGEDERGVGWHSVLRQCEDCSYSKKFQLSEKGEYK